VQVVESALLRAEQFRAGYGPVAVVHGIDLEVRPGEVVACSAPMGFADRGYTLRRGHVVLQGAAAELKALLQEIESTYPSAGGPPEAAEDIDD
jgi:ABC-type branched-subunit amino acid transport system ATPase component